MINKELVKKRFEKSLKTYDDNAIAQKHMAKTLIDYLPCYNYNSILEIGCATGILTGYIKEKLHFSQFYANDIVCEASKFIDKIIPGNIFINGDIEEIILNNKYDLIISNACLQWCGDIEKTISKLMKALNKKGILAFSTFGDNNLKEIKKIFNFENRLYSTEQLKNILNRYNILSFEEEEIRLEFDTPVDILRHLKNTGANALVQMTLTKSKLKNFEEKYCELYRTKQSVYLTYNPVYTVITNYS